VVIITGFLFYLFLIHLCIFVDLFTWSFVDLFCIFLFTCIFFYTLKHFKGAIVIIISQKKLSLFYSLKNVFSIGVMVNLNLKTAFVS